MSVIYANKDLYRTCGKLLRMRLPLSIPDGFYSGSIQTREYIQVMGYENWTWLFNPYTCICRHGANKFLDHWSWITVRASNSMLLLFSFYTLVALKHIGPTSIAIKSGAHEETVDKKLYVVH